MHCGNPAASSSLAQRPYAPRMVNLSLTWNPLGGGGFPVGAALLSAARVRGGRRGKGRLIRQSPFSLPFTERFFPWRGHWPGPRVLDIGSGRRDCGHAVAKLVCPLLVKSSGYSSTTRAPPTVPFPVSHGPSFFADWLTIQPNPIPLKSPPQTFDGRGGPF